MARINNLTNFLSDVADAIRSKKGTSSLIPAEDFDTEIINLPSGGSTLQSKSITIRSNGSQTVSPDSGYDGLSSVSITTNVPGGSSGDFVYDNWIAYGTSTPDANDYKYWFNVDTTPTNTPLRYVSNYKAEDDFTGELAEIVDETTGISNQKVQSSFTIDGMQNDGGNNYFYSSGGQCKTPSNITVYKYTYNNQQAPSYECINTSYSTSIGKLSDILSGLSSTTLYGGWTAYNNIIYGLFGNAIQSYDVSTGAQGTWGRTSYTWLNSTYRCLGLFRISNTQMIFIRTANSSGTGINVISASNSASQSVNTLLTVNNLSNMNNYTTIRVDNDNILIIYKTNSLSLSSSIQKKMYNYKISTNTWTTVTPPASSGYMYFRYLIPENKYIFKVSSLTYSIYTLVNGAFTEMGNGNLFNACVQSDVGAILYLNGTTFRACIPKNFSIKDANGNIITSNFIQDTSYNIIEGITTKNYTFSHEILENLDSTNNVLLISNYKGSSSSQSYAFYPRPSSEIFLWLYRNGTTKFIYNKTEYTLQTSVNGAWTTSDTENNIR